VGSSASQRRVDGVKFDLSRNNSVFHAACINCPINYLGSNARSLCAHLIRKAGAKNLVFVPYCERLERLAGAECVVCVTCHLLWGKQQTILYPCAESQMCLERDCLDHCTCVSHN
jgi:hypothetical protein